MMSMARLLGDWRAVDGVNRLFQPAAFVDDAGTFITKQGRLVIAMQLTGAPDGEGLEHTQLHHATVSLEQAFQALSPRVQVNQYLFKRQIREPLQAAVGPDLARQ